MLSASTFSQNSLALGTGKRQPGAGTEAGRSGEVSIEVIRLARDGNREAWDQLVECYHTRIYHYLVNFMGNAHDAQDVTQDTFVKVYKKLHQHREGSSFTSWIFTVARRTALNFFRDRKTGEEIPDDLSTNTDSPSERVAARDDTRFVWDYVQNLKPAARQALWLRYGDGLSIQEIADIMGKTSLYVRVLLHRAKQDISTRFKAENNYDE